MQIQHLSSQLQGIASAKGWLLAHVPLTGSMAGYELFLDIANDCREGRAIPVDALLAGMRHPQPVLLEQIGQMEAAGLLARQTGAAVTYLPTQQFLELLQNASPRFDSLFVLHKDLRDQQLLVVTQDGPMHDFVATLYDYFYDLGWLYLHNFGAACFLMASLVARVAVAHGYRARIESCYVDIARGDGRYLLGGQIDGHAVCVLEECMLVDFGLGNVRRNYRRDFPWALACGYQPQAPVLGGIAMTSGETVTWKNDRQCPDAQAELARYAPHLDTLYQQYHARFG
ncbi:MAG: hypothetical protein JWR40_858 [Massilia sp.]|nr:hypothetical protein [Massilia sp.]